MTTRKFLEAFGFASLRDLPDLERLKAEGLLQRGQGEDDLDSALGLAEEELGCLGGQRCSLTLERASRATLARLFSFPRPLILLVSAARVIATFALCSLIYRATGTGPKRAF